MTLEDQIAATVREAVAVEVRALLAELGVGLPRMSYTKREAAAVLGVGETKVKELIRSNQLATVKLGGTVLIPHSEIERLLRENQTGGQSWEPHVVPTGPDRFSTEPTGNGGQHRRR